jgi:hypothetical protein
MSAFAYIMIIGVIALLLGQIIAPVVAGIGALMTVGSALKLHIDG